MLIVDYKSEIEEIKIKVEFIYKTMKQLNNSINKQPKELPISILCNEVNKSRQTIRNHLLNNYEPDLDFKIINGKILVTSNVFVAIKEYYDNKNTQKCFHSK